MVRAVLIFGLCLALATPSAAQQREKVRLTVIRPSAQALDLRGAVKAAPAPGGDARAQALDDSASLAGPPPAAADPAPLASLRGPDPGLCRQSCARDYYFCLGGDVTADCGAGWSQCRSDCNGYTPIQSFATRHGR